MFRGNHLLTLDGKGRIAVPKKYRDSLVADCGLKMVITKGEYEDCLVVYPLPEWQRIEEKLRRHPDLDPQADDAARAKAEWACRLVIGNATDCDIDSHGRLLIPPPLRTHANLEKAGPDGRFTREVRAVGRGDVEWPQHRGVPSNQGADPWGAKHVGRAGQFVISTSEGLMAIDQPTLDGCLERSDVCTVCPSVPPGERRNR